jgi:hypothetical protein
MDNGGAQDPVKVTALPPPSTAVQNEAVAQDTAVRVCPLSIEALDQETPLNVRAWPPLSTATQNEAVAHDTALSVPTPSMDDGRDHEPLYVSTFPLVSSAAQNVVPLAHDTAMSAWLSFEGELPHDEPV